MNENILVRFDWAIKNMLKNKNNYCIVEGFLFALLKEDLIVINILESENNQKNADKKVNRVDILVKNNKECNFIVILQNSYEEDCLEKLLYDTSDTIVEKMCIKNYYCHISKIISINIQYLNESIGSDYIYKTVTEVKGLYEHDILDINERKGYNVKINNKNPDKPERKDIFPDYYLIFVEQFDEKVKDDIDEWIYMMKHNKIQNSFKSKNIQKTAEKLNLLKMTEEERKNYDEYLDNILI